MSFHVLLFIFHFCITVLYDPFSRLYATSMSLLHLYSVLGLPFYFHYLNHRGSLSYT